MLQEIECTCANCDEVIALMSTCCTLSMYDLELVMLWYLYGYSLHQPSKSYNTSQRQMMQSSMIQELLVSMPDICSETPLLCKY